MVSSSTTRVAVQGLIFLYCVFMPIGFWIKMGWSSMTTDSSRGMCAIVQLVDWMGGCWCEEMILRQTLAGITHSCPQIVLGLSPWNPPFFQNRCICCYHSPQKLTIIWSPGTNLWSHVARYSDIQMSTRSVHPYMHIPVYGVYFDHDRIRRVPTNQSMTQSINHSIN